MTLIKFKLTTLRGSEYHYQFYFESSWYINREGLTIKWVIPIENVHFMWPKFEYIFPVSNCSSLSHAYPILNHCRYHRYAHISYTGENHLLILHKLRDNKPDGKSSGNLKPWLTWIMWSATICYNVIVTPWSNIIHNNVIIMS